MTQFFITVFNMSITATIIAAMLLCIRWLFGKKLPTVYCYLLWGILFFRLLVSFSLPSYFSVLNYMPIQNSAKMVNDTVIMTYTEHTTGQTLMLEGFFNESNVKTMTTIWFSVFIVFAVYGCYTYFRACINLQTAVLVKNEELLISCKKRTKMTSCKTKVYRSPMFNTPIVIGVFTPRIILPNIMDFDNERQLIHIITHELVHIKRKDHITKIITTMALMLHWFNPIVWWCYYLYGVDIETSCDEFTLDSLGISDKKGYAQSLINLASPTKKVITPTLSFSESHIESRISGVLKYKPLGKIQVFMVLSIVVLIGVITVTNPVIALTEYNPKNVSINYSVNENFKYTSLKLAYALEESDSEMVATLAQSNEIFLLPSFDWIENVNLTVEDCVLYTQSDDLAFCYLEVTSHLENEILPTGEHLLVGVIERNEVSGELVLTKLQPKLWFDKTMTLEKSEPVKLIENLHNFDIYTGLSINEGLTKPQITAFCINEEYIDRTNSGELAPNEIYIEPEWVEYSAKRYFGIEDFSYTFDERMYDANKDSYIYSPDRKMGGNSDILEAKEDGNSTIVTANLYKDPLHMVLDKTIKYTLIKNRGN